jgi:hypothetical protein
MMRTSRTHYTRRWLIAAEVAALALAGCVTINIYFPAAAAERAADRIIDEVWQLKPDGVKPPADKPASTK